VGEGPTFTTARLRALPLTVWNAGFVAEELAPRLVTAGPGPGPGAVVGVGSILVPDDGEESHAVVRRELRRRASGGVNVLTWVIRTAEGTAVGLLSADTLGRRSAVAVSIARGYRRRGYATEALRALAGWLEYRDTVVVEARVRVGDRIGERLARSTSFTPTGVVVSGQWRVWVRLPPG
jgi:hypothetical protein